MRQGTIERDDKATLLAGDVHVIEMTRKEARELMIDGPLDGIGDLEVAIDTAQGEADDLGKTAFVVLKITGERL